ncbi:MAG: hypothetical protein ACW967_09305 [Candidatus Hodarchaeales archaeon]|jgi:bifunctional DNA-binding transcriptional regulator/antitoxin component of YhaV-PrlF toxin-antitoxin module
MSTGKVGSKGELFPPKDIREQTDLIEGQKVLYRVVNRRLIVERIYSAKEILNTPEKVKLPIHELKADRKNLSEDLSDQ